MPDNAAIILAAGMGTRMKSKYPKVVHKICGKALINWVIDSCIGAGIEKKAIVVGDLKEEVIKEVKKEAVFIEQEERLGTGHAVMTASDFIKSIPGNVIVLYGDAPLLLSDTIRSLIRFHEDNLFDATVLTAETDSPYGYGRIVRSEDGLLETIIEERDANEKVKMIKEINSGVIVFKRDVLLDALGKIKNDNTQKEYYLTDTIKEINKAKGRAGAYKTSNSDEISGINDRVQLSQAAAVTKRRILERHMLNGVTVEDPDSTYIEADVKIGQDVLILPGSRIEGASVVGEDSVIGPSSRIIDSVIGQGSKIDNSIVIDSRIGSNTKIGPYSYIRPESVIGNDIKIGDFVEIKKSTIGNRTKISHLTYVGDALIGENCNLGCGVVVVNYDGKKKSATVVGDNAFIGCNVNLIAPVEVEKDTYIAAGSTINKKVPEGSLAIARSRQTNIENWIARRNMQRK